MLVFLSFQLSNFHCVLRSPRRFLEFMFSSPSRPSSVVISSSVQSEIVLSSFLRCNPAPARIFFLPFIFRVEVLVVLSFSPPLFSLSSNLRCPSSQGHFSDPCFLLSVLWLSSSPFYSFPSFSYENGPALCFLFSAACLSLPQGYFFQTHPPFFSVTSLPSSDSSRYQFPLSLRILFLTL